ncbi:calcineurin-like metallo-phosphoesterase superfamily protein, partial [Trifolium medium]|nr:calcineurin-like metallo-phosphoesterase superfamily protein [Trifolium medium]
MKPEFLDMVPWYSGTSADLFKTVFDLLVSVTVFVGRFDMRMMQ